VCRVSCSRIVRTPALWDRKANDRSKLRGSIGVAAQAVHCENYGPSGERVPLLERPAAGRVRGLGELQRAILKVADDVMHDQNCRR
jgi:hypothetical protein